MLDQVYDVRLESERPLGKIFVSNTLSCKQQKIDRRYSVRLFFSHNKMFRGSCHNILSGTQTLSTFSPVIFDRWTIAIVFFYLQKSRTVPGIL